jgi:hypothetical protein
MPSARTLLVAALCAPVALLGSPASGGTISLAWDAVSHPDLAGYRVYYDTVSGRFGNSVQLGLVTSTTLSGLADCTSYEVAIKAFDGGGAESLDYSNLVTGWSRPRLTAAAPSQVARGSRVDLAISGANFASGLQAIATDPAITIHDVTVVGCLQATVDVTVGTQAALGAAYLRVVNPDGVFGEATGLFSVVADTTAPQITAVQAGSVGATTATVTSTTNEPADSTVYFRRQGETAYHATPLDATQTTSHAVVLEGLVPAASYQFHVRSADAAGNATVSAPDGAFVTTASPYLYIRFEAETGVLTSPLAVVTGAGAFETQWVRLPSSSNGSANNPSGTADYAFYVPRQATWHLWIRAWGSAADGDSWFEAIDAAGLQSAPTSKTGAWEWVAGRSYSLGVGLHTLRLGGDQGEARADRILITDDPNFTPTEDPGDDVTAPAKVAGLSATPGDDTIALSWTNPSDPGPLSIVIRVRTDGVYPRSPADGLPVAALPGTPGSPGSHTHGGLTYGVPYRYSVFAVDAWGNASDPASVESTPLGTPPGSVDNLHRTDTE